MFFKKAKSPNYGPRVNAAKPNILLFHYTGMKSAKEARERLCDPEAQVSAHYLIDEDGSVELLVPEKYRAWHAGAAYWKGQSDINSLSIGLEIVNPGHEFGYRTFPQVQMDAVLKLSKEICKRHDIRYFLAHSDVAPERKTDPGELFDWAYLANSGAGGWPEPEDEDYHKAQSLVRNDNDMERALVKFGYNPASAYVDVLTAFQRHYYPQAFAKGTQGRLCEDTAARLCWLLRHS